MGLVCVTRLQCTKWSALYNTDYLKRLHSNKQEHTVQWWWKKSYRRHFSVDSIQFNNSISVAKCVNYETKLIAVEEQLTEMEKNPWEKQDSESWPVNKHNVIQSRLSDCVLIWFRVFGHRGLCRGLVRFAEDLCLVDWVFTGDLSLGLSKCRRLTEIQGWVVATAVYDGLSLFKVFLHLSQASFPNWKVP